MTLSAAGALIIIHFGAEAVNSDCFCRAGLYALHAADTAGGAFFAGGGAFIVVFAYNRRLNLFKRHHLNKIFGAGFYAHFTGLTGRGIYAGNTVAD